MTLSPLEPEDLELLYTIENEPALWDVSSTTVPYSRYHLRQYIATQQADIYADRQLRLVIRTDDGAAVGLIDLFNFEPRHQRAEMGIALLQEARGKGYAQEAIRQLAHYARHTLRLHQLYCIVPATHAPSLRMLRRAGFQGDTPLPDWLLAPDGSFQDALLLQMKLS